MKNRDKVILEHILMYCDQIHQAVELFGNAYEKFESDAVYRNACCMCILQIGEITSKLSKEIQEMRPEIPWRAIKDMRNICAHTYGDIDIETVWDTITNDIPAFRNECERILEIIDI